MCAICFSAASVKANISSGSNIETDKAALCDAFKKNLPVANTDACFGSANSSATNDFKSASEYNHQTSQAVYKSLLKKLDKKFQKKVRLFLKMSLKTKNSKKIKKYKVTNDEVYKMFNTVLSEDDVNIKNFSKKLRYKGKELLKARSKVAKED